MWDEVLWVISKQFRVFWIQVCLYPTCLSWNKGIWTLPALYLFARSVLVREISVAFLREVIFVVEFWSVFSVCRVVWKVCLYKTIVFRLRCILHCPKDVLYSEASLSFVCLLVCAGHTSELFLFFCDLYRLCWVW